MMQEHIELGDRQAEFVRSAIASGRFQDVNEVVRAAVLLLEKHLEEERRRTKLLRKMLEEAEASGVCEESPREVWAAVEARYKSNDA